MNVLCRFLPCEMDPFPPFLLLFSMALHCTHHFNTDGWGVARSSFWGIASPASSSGFYGMRRKRRKERDPWMKKRGKMWGQGESNTQPFDLESNALPLRHALLVWCLSFTHISHWCECGLGHFDWGKKNSWTVGFSEQTDHSKKERRQPMSNCEEMNEIAPPRIVTSSLYSNALINLTSLREGMSIGEGCESQSLSRVMCLGHWKEQL